MKKYLGIASLLLMGMLANVAQAGSFSDGLKGDDLPTIGSGGGICFTPGVPEPGTWSMIGVGVGMIAYQLRRRGKKNHKSDLS